MKRRVQQNQTGLSADSNRSHTIQSLAGRDHNPFFTTDAAAKIYGLLANLNFTTDIAGYLLEDPGRLIAKNNDIKYPCIVSQIYIFIHI